ncbi:hypothetical protein [Methanosarcina sp.]|uniref:hypothetical protein n=1 Tax=Methanosarcina sp. TaxID=2213 RepID=UPI003BB7177C
MSSDNEPIPLTITRKIEIPFYRLKTKQQYFLMGLLFLIVLTLLIGTRTVGYHTTNQIVKVQAVIELIIFLYIGLSPARLYQCEKFLLLMWSMQDGSDTTEKFAKEDLKKIRDTSNIKKIHLGGFVEYFTDFSLVNKNKRKNNWAIFYEIKGFKPDKIVPFLQAVEKMFMGMDDGSAMKTTMTIRDDLKDYSEPIKTVLNQEGMPQIVRQSLYEHQEYIKNAKVKTYGNYMIYYLPYTASKKDAIKKLKIAVKNINRSLDDNKIHYKRLRFAFQIHNMFKGILTYNYHDSRGGFVDEDII